MGGHPDPEPEAGPGGSSIRIMTDKDQPVPSEAPRIAIDQVAPKLYQAYLHLETTVRRAGLDPALYELVKIRASQINGCAFCVDMHTKDAQAAGEAPERLHLVAAWREAPYYTARERAALALTESVTQVSTTHVPDDVWDAAAAVFSQEELAALVMAIVAINGWNRMAITSRTPAGQYQPADRAATTD